MICQSVWIRICDTQIEIGIPQMEHANSLQIKIYFRFTSKASARLFNFDRDL